MSEKPVSLPGKKKITLYERIQRILESARTNMARTVNTTQVVANWLIGREIVEEEQKGLRRAVYGERLIWELALRLTSEYGSGYNLANLKFFRKFYFEYPKIFASSKSYALRSQSVPIKDSSGNEIGHTLRGQSSSILVSIGALHEAILQKGYALRSESWQPGRLHPNLSWTHYRTLLRVDKVEAHFFHEIEAIQNNWSARELDPAFAGVTFLLVVIPAHAGIQKSRINC